MVCLLDDQCDKQYLGSTTDLSVTLLDYLDGDEEQVKEEGYGGNGCECKLCSKLKNIEDDWIMTLGTLNYPGG